ncbi:MAG: hypothetical protein V2A61_05735, partial [Calditrichota bacterium]
LLSDLIKETENLSISDEELEEQIRRIAEQVGKPLAEIQDIYNKDENARKRLRDRLSEDLVVGFLAKHAIVDKREIKFDEFLQLLKKRFDEDEDIGNDEESDEDSHIHQ